uniref:Uncharacterized protein n=1 Tax=Timema cristinae TaxID=61476 RepID=A0A7R9CZ03_TIMCR|nr:unnamed protein product [Timema cristinae]
MDFLIASCRADVNSLALMLTLSPLSTWSGSTSSPLNFSQSGVTRNAPACQSSLNYSSLWKLEMMTVRECTHHFKYFLHHVGGHAHTWAFFLLPFLLYFSLCAPS